MCIHEGIRSRLDSENAFCHSVENPSSSRLFVCFPGVTTLLVVFSQPSSGLQPPRFRGFLITHNDAPQSVDSPGRVISSSQRSVPDNTQHSQPTNIHAPGGIRTHNLSRRAAEDLRLRPRGHWNRLISPFAFQKYKDSNIQTYNFFCCFVWVWNLVSHSEGGT